MRSAFIIFILLFVGFYSFAQYPETFYEVEDGLPHSSIRGITSDANGFIWILTNDGISRFDGTHFKPYHININNRSLPIAIAPKGILFRDRNKRIWIQNSLSSIVYYDIKHDMLRALEETNCGYCQNDVECDDDGNIYIISDWQFVKFKRKADFSFSRTDYKVPEEIGDLIDLHIFEDGRILANAQGKLYHFITDSDTILRVKEIKLLIKEKPSELEKSFRFVRADNHLLLVSSHKIFSTSIPATGPFRDTTAKVEQIMLDFPEIDLHTNNFLHAVVPGKKDELIIRSTGGIYRYNIHLKTAERIRIEYHVKYPSYPGSSNSAFHYGRDGVLWVGFPKRLLKIDIDKKPFNWVNNVHPITGNLNPLNSFIDSRRRLWFAKDKDTLYLSFPEPDGTYKKNIGHKLICNDSLAIYNIRLWNAFEDSHNRIWTKSDNMLQWMYTNEPGVLHRSSFLNFVDRFNLHVNTTSMELFEDPGGNILLTTYNPSYCWLLRPGTDKAFVITIDSTGKVAQWPTYVKTMDNELYMHNDSKFYRISSQWKLNSDSLLNTKIENEHPVPWAHPLKTELLFDLDSLGNFLSRVMLTEHKGQQNVWIEVQNMQKLVKCNLNLLRKNPGNPSKALSYFPQEKEKYISKRNSWIADKNGKLWYTTTNGLMCIDPATNKTSHYYQSDGLPFNNFIYGAHISTDGMISLNTHIGLVYFYPDSILPDLPPKVFLTDFELYNKKVNIAPESVLNTSITFTDQVRLNHKQNFIGISFTALDYRNPKHVKYKYKMEGLDTEWISANEGKKAQYPNLRPGRYVFKVIAANGNGVWNTEGTSINIHILPPIWLRWWALCLEGIILIFIFIYYIRKRERNLKHRAAILEKKVEFKTKEVLEQRKEVDEMKSRFYSNISHEFRTPLSLLLDPLESALRTQPYKANLSKKVVEMMHRNAKRLQNLINQLLDASKIESGKMFLNLRPGKISNFVNAIAGAFLSLAESRNIIYSINIQHSGKTCLFDTDKLEKIITNLLSNAFKFTENGDSVKLSFSLNEIPDKNDGCLAKLTVSDTGRGISKDQQQHIFERFYQVSDSDTRIAEGSGIGLSLTRELVELMEGNITLESEAGKGSSFNIQFPLSYTTAPAEPLHETVSTVTTTSSAQSSFAEASDVKGKRKAIILIVEDNEDLRDYIALQFSKKYKLIKSIHGKDGLEKAKQYLPDLIITDLMMPKMDGIELCTKLKSNPDTSLIPVIMLTAKADKSSRMVGLKASADDYITKPFDSEELLVRTENLINQRKGLKQKLTQQLLSNNSGGNDTQEKLILNKYLLIIDKHMGDPNFSVLQLADQLNMSRTQLFRQIHIQLDTSPGEFIRLARMKRAAQLLRESKLTVSQIMFQVGMQNTSHFSTSFKKYYGVNPAEYRNER